MLGSVQILRDPLMERGGGGLPKNHRGSQSQGMACKKLAKQNVLKKEITTLRINGWFKRGYLHKPILT